MKRLKILTPTYYALFAHDYSYTIKIFYNKIDEEDYNLKEFNAEAAANSIQLENRQVNLIKYLEFFKNPDAVNKKEVAFIDNVVKAYEFAQKRPINAANIIKVHSMLSKTILPPKQRGAFRTVDYELKDLNAKHIYEAPSYQYAEKNFYSIINDIEILLKRELRLNLCFYYASYLHIGLHQISPFFDGNGILARLLEKWFLASKIDRRAWLIPSERFYFFNANDYFRNFQNIGKNFSSIDNEKALDFSLMLANSLEANVLQD